MATVHDVASYILKQLGPTSAMKLQKLVYYCQAWSLVWDERPLFSARIEASVSGPVVPVLYKSHKGKFMVANWPIGNPKNLTDKRRETIDGVVNFYGPKTAQWLSDLTHREKPWQEARVGLAKMNGVAGKLALLRWMSITAVFDADWCGQIPKGFGSNSCRWKAAQSRTNHRHNWCASLANGAH